MGCAASKGGVEASMEQCKANAAKGFPNLMSALEQPSEEDICKTSVPKVFELLPSGLGHLSLTGGDVKAVTAACSVIERSVKLANDPAIGVATPTIPSEIIQQCTSQLTVLMKKALEKAKASFKENLMEDAVISKEVKAIAGAMKALLKLEDHVATVVQAFNPSMKVAVGCVGQKLNSGLTTEAQQEVVSMFAALLEVPESVQAFIDAQGTYVLLPYCTDPKTCGANRDFQITCMGVLESCINSGLDIKNKAAVEDAIQKAKNAPPESGWGKSFSANSKNTN